ncbi:MAG: hypothetical protein PSV16_11545 [Flavobacterium sp.]|nr:hypothetical protein [Flavobacterium sp.]
MKTKKGFVIEYYLRALHLRSLSEKEPEHLNPIFLKAYNNAELRSMVKFMSGKESPGGLDLGTVDEDKMLDTIKEEHPGLSNTLSELADGFEQYNNITDEKIFATFANLEMGNHYLQTKPLVDWDDDDRNIYWELSEKAGDFVPLYAIYSAYLHERDKFVALKVADDNTQIETPEKLPNLHIDVNLVQIYVVQLADDNGNFVWAYGNPKPYYYTKEEAEKVHADLIEKNDDITNENSRVKEFWKVELKLKQ